MLDLHLQTKKPSAEINIIPKKYESFLKVFLLYRIVCSVFLFIIILHRALFYILNYVDIEETKSYNRIVPTIG